MNQTTWDLIKPIAAQFMRDFLRTVGTYLAAKGLVQGDAGVATFIGAGMALAGLFWGWFTTKGYLQVGALLQKLTAAHNKTDAVEKAQAMPAADPAKVASSIVKAAVSVLLVAFVLSLFLAGNPAMAQGLKLVKPTGNIAQDIAAATGSRTTITGAPVTDLQNFLNAKFLPDLQYALKLAQASKNSITADCYQAWIDIITTQQTAVLDSSTPPQPLAMPDPHVITEFEKLVELRNALQPESPFMIKCSPVASMVKLDIAKFMGLVISGGAGLATLVPGL